MASSCTRLIIRSANGCGVRVLLTVLDPWTDLRIDSYPLDFYGLGKRIPFASLAHFFTSLHSHLSLHLALLSLSPRLHSSLSLASVACSLSRPQRMDDLTFIAPPVSSGRKGGTLPHTSPTSATLIEWKKKFRPLQGP